MRTGLILTKSARAAALAFTWITAASCSANSEGSSFGNAGNGGAGGSSAGGSGGTQNILNDASIGDGTLDEAGACVGESFPGKLVPLDVYVLLDATASMNGANDTPVVWPSVVAALQDVITDPLSEGIGMGLTYLPNPPPPGFHVPGSCATNADCPGDTGPCEPPAPGAFMLRACSHACATAQDCGLYGGCNTMFPGKAYCEGSWTTNVSCDPADYGQPVVPIDTLPGNESALLSAINGKDPDGDATPTQPSLEGTLMFAHQWAVDHPTHLVHVLFATDGLPNDCTYNTIDGAALAAKTAFEDVPSVPTFVLGIGDLADLNAIASAGGTGSAYIANGGSVGQKLVEVFNEIRANGACQFQIPPPPDGQTLDYERVNVYYTPLGSNEQQPVKYVGDKSQCDPVEGGWYYDDPTKQHPTKIILCPATCEGVKLSSEGVSVMLGCKTIVK